MISIYVFKTSQYNITNLPQSVQLCGRSDLYGASQVALDHGRILYATGQFVSDFNVDRSKFRNIVWSDHIDTLDKIINNGNKVIFAVDDSKQLKFLKEYYQNRILTVSCSYTKDAGYDTMLSWLARYHVRMQDIGYYTMTDVDRSIRAAGTDLLEYYKNAFHDANLIPRDIEPIGDYNIPITDFFEVNKFINHMTIINQDIDPPGVEFYKSWLEQNK